MAATPRYDPANVYGPSVARKSREGVRWVTGVGNQGGVAGVTVTLQLTKLAVKCNFCA